jgi:hypothetical protein
VMEMGLLHCPDSSHWCSHSGTVAAMYPLASPQ